MKLVIDTNILFSYFWKRSVTRTLLMSQKLQLFAPEYALLEIKKYKSEIMKKAKLTEKDFLSMQKELVLAVVFVPTETYASYLRKALQVCPDCNDADFFALALCIEAPLWSNDSLLKQQSTLHVFTTRDLLANYDFGDAIFPID